ncbi:hypothetical protein SAMN05421803_11585 [Nocardiopsis flavescens]|uniref:Apea-like HEPN domain-containing protein n=1 Tax=Nocardiopsis flavescens TaxID=758803 RepID=A0A1M6QJG3_9ACTN|nr:HEPN domain-containing protein [Nocardiopsis flavescens]SHK20308.1 hypothetical protein SAMN05421803_11585 [Nocardiopsis flavescens]
MDDKAALKSVISPGEYAFTVHVPSSGGDKVSAYGLVDLQAGRQPTAQIQSESILVEHENSGGAISGSFPQRKDFDVLEGRLFNGMAILFIEARLTYWDFSTARIDCRAAMVGASTSSVQNSFSMVELQITGMDSVFGANPIKETTYPVGDSEERFSMVVNEESSQEWSDEEFRVLCSYDSSAKIADPYAFRVSFSPVCRVYSVSPLTFSEWFDSWVEPLIHVTSLVTGVSESLAYVALGRDRKVTPFFPEGFPRHEKFQVFGTGVLQAPYSSSANKIRLMKPAVGLKEDDVSLLGMIREWQEMESCDHPLIEIYGTSLGFSSQHPRAHFLMLIQALEGYHGYENREKEEEEEEKYKAKKKEFFGLMKDKISPSEMRFLRKYLKGSNADSLETRLIDLLAGLPLDMTQRIAKMKIIQSVLEGAENQGPLWAVARIRNDLAHGNRGYKDSDLAQLSHMLERVVRAYMMKCLELGEEFQARMLRDDLYF